MGSTERGRQKTRRALLALLCGGLVAAAGCGDGEDAEAPRAAAPAPTATPAATAAPTPGPAPVRRVGVRFRASDGKPVKGRFAPAGRNAPALVLLHQLDGGASQWDEFVPVLHAAGFATLAYESRQEIAEADRLPDLAGALRWLRGRRDVDAGRLGLVGASIGASTTVLAMATKAGRGVKAAVALSPPDSSDIWDLQDSNRYRPHDVLFVADDRESVTVEGYIDGAVRSRALKSAGSGHGVALLPEPDVSGAVVDWLRRRVR